MTVTDVRKDTDALSMTITAEFDASPERVWQLWAIHASSSAGGVRRATRRRSPARPAGRSRDRLPHDRPEGRQPRGYWEIVEVDPPSSLDLPRRLCRRRGSANHDMPVGTAEMKDRGHRRRSDANVDREPVPEAKAMELILRWARKRE